MTGNIRPLVFYHHDNMAYAVKSPLNLLDLFAILRLHHRPSLSRLYIPICFRLDNYVSCLHALSHAILRNVMFISQTQHIYIESAVNIVVQRHHVNTLRRHVLYPSRSTSLDLSRDQAYSYYLKALRPPPW